VFSVMVVFLFSLSVIAIKFVCW